MTETTMVAPPASAGRCPAWCQAPRRGEGHEHYVTVADIAVDDAMPAGDDVTLWPRVSVEVAQRPGEQLRVSVCRFLCEGDAGEELDLDQATELHRALGAALALARTEATR